VIFVTVRKALKAISVYLIAACIVTIVSVCLSQEWGELKGDHFIVHYMADRRFARDVIHKAEGYYKRIATDLGYPRYSEFWTWDNRVKIYLYPDHKTYLAASSRPSWSHGMARYDTKEILSYAWGQGFLETLLPHELAHLIFRDFVGFTGEIPQWLDEGVAQWAETGRRELARKAIRILHDKRKLFSLKDMISLDVRGIKSEDTVVVNSIRPQRDGGSALSLGGNEFVDTYYMQAVSLIDFLIQRFGATDFTRFCRELRDGESLDEALRSTYSAHIRNLNELENKWMKFVEERY